MQKRFLNILVAVLLIMPTSAYAHSPADGNNAKLEELVAKSDAIFFGEVREVIYRMSRPTQRAPKGLPHTFVRYQILSGIRGAVSREIILRFVGGTDGKGGVMIQSNVPTFRKGERDVLLVSGGELDDCPLVSCVDGRFRVLDGRMYNGWGIPIVSIEGNMEMRGRPRYDVNVLEYPRPEFEDLITRPEFQETLREMIQVKSLAEIKRTYEEVVPKTVRVSYTFSESADPGRDDPGKDDQVSKSENFPEVRSAIPLSEFIRALRTASQDAREPRNKVLSINPARPFFAYEKKIGALPNIELRKRTPTAEEEMERRSTFEGDDL
jgi:hypothetical protein